MKSEVTAMCVASFAQFHFAQWSLEGEDVAICHVGINGSVAQLCNLPLTGKNSREGDDGAGACMRAVCDSEVTTISKLMVRSCRALDVGPRRSFGVNTF